MNTIAIGEAVSSILKEVGEDPSREGLLDTPRRVAKAYSELLAGYEQSAADVIVTFEEPESNGLVVVKDIPFYSLCEHHMLPFRGVAHVGYVPNGRVLGLSKFARVVDVFARRLQVQERMTREVCDALFYSPVLNPRAVLVVVEAEHFCMAMRGVQKPGATTATHAFRFAPSVSDKKAALWVEDFKMQVYRSMR